MSATSPTKINRELDNLQRDLNRVHQIPRANWTGFKIKKGGGFTSAPTDDPTVATLYQTLSDKVEELRNSALNVNDKNNELEKLKKQVANFTDEIAKIIKFRQLVHYEKPITLNQLTSLKDDHLHLAVETRLGKLKDIKMSEHPGMVAAITVNNVPVACIITDSRNPKNIGPDTEIVGITPVLTDKAIKWWVPTLEVLNDQGLLPKIPHEPQPNLMEAVEPSSNEMSRGAPMLTAAKHHQQKAQDQQRMKDQQREQDKKVEFESPKESSEPKPKI